MRALEQVQTHRALILCSVCKDSLAYIRQAVNLPSSLV
jgi:hypothetical protein